MTISDNQARIIVTGFEKFDCHPVNPTEQIVNALAELSTGRYATHVLPVTYRDCRIFSSDILYLRSARAVLLLGLWAKTDRIQIERIAVNIEDATIPDNEGDLARDRQICPGGPAAYFSTLPIRKLESALLHAGHDCRISNSAGTYI